MKRLKPNYLILALLSANLGLTPTSALAATPSFKAKKLASFTSEQISTAVSTLGVEIPDEQFKYSVNLYSLNYETTDGYGKKVIASGLVAIPDKGIGVPSPLLSFQHGTIFQDKEAPSKDLVAGAPPTILAALGYVTVASDYVGYGASKGKPHPYLLKTPSANAVTDLLKSASKWLKRNNISLNKQLFLTGYSEGGYVTMAAHQELQAQPINGLNLAVSIPAAGPYNISRTLKSLTSLSSARLQAAEEQRLSPILVDWLTAKIMDKLIPNNSDVVFQDTIIRDFLRKGSSGVTQHNVHDWQAKSPIVLFHGRKDATVPYFNATDAVKAMTTKGSANVILVECTATPADHENCIPEYRKVLIQTLGNYAQDL